MEVSGAINSVSQAEIDRLRKFLSRQIGKPIKLEVEIIPTRVLKSANSR